MREKKCFFIKKEGGESEVHFTPREVGAITEVDSDIVLTQGLLGFFSRKGEGVKVEGVKDIHVEYGIGGVVISFRRKK